MIIFTSTKTTKQRATGRMTRGQAGSREGGLYMKNNEKGWETSNVSYIAITDLQATTDKDDDKRGKKRKRHIE